VKLLEAALPSRDGKFVVPEPLKEWLRTAAARGAGAPPPPTLDVAGGRRLQLSVLSSTGEGESLFRIASDDGTDQEASLRRQFSLTGREAEVLLWIAQGKSNRDIGEILGLSPRTVNKHLEQIYQKLGVENRASAAIAALKALDER
jgi:DNA-binding CsgD family transcriptional regulator